MNIRFTAFWNLTKLLLFCTFWLLWNFYSGDTHHSNYFELCLNHHFFNWAHCVYQIYSVFKSFVIAVCFGTFWFLRNFYSGDAHHVNYGESCSIHHFFHLAHCVYQIYSVFKLFEFPVCFVHFGFYKISTPVMRTMLTMPNIIYINISNTP